MLLSAQQLLLAAEEEREGIDLVIPEPAELIGGTLAFLVVLFLLGRLVFPKIRDAIRAREEQIQGQLSNAESTRAEADQLLADYRSQLADAKGEANRIIEEARQSAEQVRRDMIAKAEQDAQTIVERASEQIEAERQRTVQELQGSIADLSIELAEKVVGRSLDAPAQRDMVDAYIREVSGMSSNGGSR